MYIIYIYIPINGPNAVPHMRDEVEDTPPAWESSNIITSTANNSVPITYIYIYTYIHIWIYTSKLGTP